METNKQRAELWWNTTVPESEIVEWKLSMLNKYYGNRPLKKITPEMKEQMWLSENKKEVDLLEGITIGEWKWRQSRGNNKYEHIVYAGVTVIAELGQTAIGNDDEVPEIIANAKIISQAPLLANRVKELEGEIEELKRTNIMTATMALEFGYTQCEKGNNIQMAFINFNKLSQ